MKQSVKTAERIHYEIDQAQKAVRELHNALGELDRGTLPHNLLQKAYDEKVKELNALKRTEYQVAEAPQLGGV